MIEQQKQIIEMYQTTLQQLIDCQRMVKDTTGQITATKNRKFCVINALEESFQSSPAQSVTKYDPVQQQKAQYCKFVKLYNSS